MMNKQDQINCLKESIKELVANKSRLDLEVALIDRQIETLSAALMSLIAKKD